MILEESLMGFNDNINLDNDYSMEFKKVLDNFLDKSKDEYPINIVVTGEETINIVLLKNIKNIKYEFDYENAIEDIFKFLIDLIPSYGLHDINYNNDDYGFHPMFNIKVPISVSSEDLDKYWDEIFEKVVNYAESKNIEFILDDLSIILCR